MLAQRRRRPHSVHCRGVAVRIDASSDFDFIMVQLLHSLQAYKSLLVQYARIWADSCRDKRTSKKTLGSRPFLLGLFFGGHSRSCSLRDLRGPPTKKEEGKSRSIYDPGPGGGLRWLCGPCGPSWWLRAASVHPRRKVRFHWNRLDRRFL